MSKLAYIAGLFDTIATLRAENARLREALERIANVRPWVGDDPAFWDGYDMARESDADTARAALAAKEPGHE